MILTSTCAAALPAKTEALALTPPIATTLHVIVRKTREGNTAKGSNLSVSITCAQTTLDALKFHRLILINVSARQGMLGSTAIELITDVMAIHVDHTVYAKITVSDYTLVFAIKEYCRLVFLCKDRVTWKSTSALVILAIMVSAIT